MTIETDSNKWIEEKIKFFRNLSFFEMFKEKTNAELGAHLLGISKADDYWGELEENKVLSGWQLLSYDTNRVWLINDSAILGGVSEFKNNFYKTVLEKLAAISLGKFNPLEIKVTECGVCEGRGKRISLAFSCNSKQFELTFCADWEALVLNFLEELNEVIADTGYSFEYNLDEYGPCIVLFINEKEKEELIKAGWIFRHNPYYWVDKAKKCEETEDMEKAGYYFKKAYAMSPSDMTIACDYGFCLIANSKKNEGKEIFAKAISLLRDQIENGNETGSFYLDLFTKEMEKL